MGCSLQRYMKDAPRPSKYFIQLILGTVLPQTSTSGSEAKMRGALPPRLPCLDGIT